jgi:hypothetical protein
MINNYGENDQLYEVDGKLRAEIDVYLTRKHESEPQIKDCRFAALPVRDKTVGWAIYDRLLCRIVNGVFARLEDALGVAQLYNDGYGAPDMSPNGAALGLRYPKPSKEK